MGDVNPSSAVRGDSRPEHPAGRDRHLSPSPLHLSQGLARPIADVAVLAANRTVDVQRYQLVAHQRVNSGSFPRLRGKVRMGVSRVKIARALDTLSTAMRLTPRRVLWLNTVPLVAFVLIQALSQG